MTKKKIEKLTAEQESYLPVFRQKYLDIACSGKRIDRIKLEVAIGDAYAVIGKPKPMVFILQSPLQAMMAIRFMKHFKEIHDSQSLWGQLGDQLWGQLGDQLWGQLWDQLGDQLWDQLRDQLWDQLWDQPIYDSNYLGGSHSLSWIAWAKFAEHIGVKLQKKTATHLDIMHRISAECEWWWPYEGFCFVSEKPLFVKWDDRRLLHSETGPSVEYADGYSLYSWHGTRIPEEWLKDRESLTPKIALTWPKIALTWPNMEQRRAACEIKGWASILKELDAKTINKDDNPQLGELVEVELPDVGTERFLRVLCGTGREFALCVTQFKHMTARECNAATYGWTSDQPIEQFLPIMRT